MNEKIPKENKTPGIYQILHALSGMVYVGQSTNIKRRMATHLRLLRSNSHENQRLQRAWKKYGEEFFVFSIIEIVEDLSILTQREQYWIDFLRSASGGGFNMCPAAGSCLGFKHSKESLKKRSGKPPWNKGKKGEYKLNPASEDRKKKIGEAQKGEKNHMFGKRTSLEAITKMRISNGGSKCYLAKLNEEKVMLIKKALAAGERGIDLARKYGVAETQISSIRNGKTWRHVIC